MFVSCIATPRSSASSRVPVAVAGGEDRQAQAADRTGDVTAVDDELVEGLVAGAPNVELDPLDQQLERLQRQVEALMRVGERDRHRVAIRAPGAGR